ncbi:unnamed protein product [Linum trigynum]|uniref:S-protein homolog n=1 Tax=Linum trigynum TaxID=586398 RepID=A0AAV2FDK8_9ROSI
MRHNSAILATVLLLAAFAMPADSFFEKTRVMVQNDLQGGQEMKVHCKSKDDDIGVHFLKQHGSISWKFRPSFWGNTLFFCYFNWGEGFKHIDVYHQYRDEDDFTGCHHFCHWLVRATGPCLIMKNGLNCYNWPENMLPHAFVGERL